MATLKMEKSIKAQINLSTDEAERLTVILECTAGGGDELYDLYDRLSDEFPKASENYEFIVTSGGVPTLRSTRG